MASPKDPMAQAQADAFLSALFATAPPTDHTYLWTIPDKISHWHPVAAGAGVMAARAVELSKRCDVYVAVSVAEVPGPPDRRISSDNSAGIMGLWADIDIAEPNIHKKFNLPPTEAAAMSILDATGLPPTMTVHSGHGLQAWWLFEHFWSFEAESDRQQAALLARKWNETLRVYAHELGRWVVDSTFDLARVMRVPGTFNRKSDPLQPVTILTDSEIRYSPELILGHVRSSETGSASDEPVEEYVITEKIVLKADATPPFKKLQALMDNVPAFKEVWERKRAFESESESDLSVASHMVRADWTDQETANGIISFRSHGSEKPEKALVMSYIHLTLRKAHQRTTQEQAVERIDDALEESRVAIESGDPEIIKDTRLELMGVLGVQCGNLMLIDFVKYLTEEPSFALITPTRTIPIPNITVLDNQVKFRQAIIKVVTLADDILMSNDKFRKLVTTLRQNAREEDLGEELTARGRVRVWLEDYLAAKPPVGDKDEAVENGYPWREKEGVFIMPRLLNSFVRYTTDEHLKEPDLVVLLSSFGCTRKTKDVRVGGKATTRSVWLIPGSAL